MMRRLATPNQWRPTRVHVGLARVCILSLVMGLLGCYVPITHTPRVEPGLSISAGATLSYGLPDSGSLRIPNPAGLIAVSLGTRFGGSDRAPGLQITDAISIWNGIMVDAYLQAPTYLTRGLDVGAGAAFVATPLYGPEYYLQIGHRFHNEVYIFTTQAVSFMRSGRDTVARQPWWQPTIAIQPPSRLSANAHFYFMTFTLGPTRYRCHSAGFTGCLFQQPGASIAIGIIATKSLTGGGFRPVPLGRPRSTRRR